MMLDRRSRSGTDRAGSLASPADARGFAACDDSASTPGALLESTCRLATEVLGCACNHTVLVRPAQDCCVVMAANGDTSHEEWTCFAGLTVPGTAVAELLDCLHHGALLQGPTWCLPEDAIPFPKRFGVTWSLYMPLRWDHELVGYQHAGYAGRTTPLSARDERHARALANLSAAGLATLRSVGTLDDADRFKERFLGK